VNEVIPVNKCSGLSIICRTNANCFGRFAESLFIMCCLRWLWCLNNLCVCPSQNCTYYSCLTKNTRTQANVRCTMHMHLLRTIWPAYYINTYISTILPAYCNMYWYKFGYHSAHTLVLVAITNVAAATIIIDMIQLIFTDWNSLSHDTMHGILIIIHWNNKKITLWALCQ